MSSQAPSAVVMIRPSHFSPNTATAADNTFQRTDYHLTTEELERRAYLEATNVAESLRERGVIVHLFEDTGDDRPDSVFPNNWFSTHPAGTVAIYPMYSPSRRGERRQDVIELLIHDYRVQEVIDFSSLEAEGLFLEGTGAMVLDHPGKMAYVCRSNRANPEALDQVSGQLDYEPLVFDAVDEEGIPVYHTNVLMCIATEYALVGLDMIPDVDQRQAVVDRLESTGKTVIGLSNEQVRSFAGNGMELESPAGRFLAISRRGLDSFTDEQRTIVEESSVIVPLEVPTIELAGGSVRCMLAGVHLDPRQGRLAPTG